MRVETSSNDMIRFTLDLNSESECGKAYLWLVESANEAEAAKDLHFEDQLRYLASVVKGRMVTMGWLTPDRFN